MPIRALAVRRPRRRRARLALDRCGVLPRHALRRRPRSSNGDRPRLWSCPRPPQRCKLRAPCSSQISASQPFYGVALRTGPGLEAGQCPLQRGVRSGTGRREYSAEVIPVLSLPHVRRAPACTPKTDRTGQTPTHVSARGLWIACGSVSRRAGRTRHLRPGPRSDTAPWSSTHRQEAAMNNNSPRWPKAPETEPITAQSALGLRLVLSGTVLPLFCGAAALFAVWAVASLISRNSVCRPLSEAGGDRWADGCR